MIIPVLSIMTDSIVLGQDPTVFLAAPTIDKPVDTSFILGRILLPLVSISIIACIEISPLNSLSSINSLLDTYPYEML
jgi:hypothetical protein